MTRTKIIKGFINFVSAAKRKWISLRENSMISGNGQDNENLPIDGHIFHSSHYQVHYEKK